MNILLLGKNGQVGWELQRALAPLGRLVALDRHGREGLCGDVADLDGLIRTVREVTPDVIVNASAYTAVDKAESEPDVARRVNAEAPGVLAAEAERIGAWIIHYSTDYVFDGSGSRPWAEEDAPAPLSVYGQTKLEGEQAIMRAASKALVMRTSWVYATRGGNFAKTMLRLAQERDSLKVVNDQIGAPTGADLLADVTAHVLRRVAADTFADMAGIYHVCADGETSWHGYARFVLDLARGFGCELKVQPECVEPIPSSAYPTPAPRPLNSRLRTDKFRNTFGLALPAWKDGVARMVHEILSR